jgi:predicted nucleic acid-binding protein
MSVNEEVVALTDNLATIYKKTSRYDIAALALAQYESLTLLTDDRALREAAKKEKVHLHGTIWVVEELLRHKKIQKKKAIGAFEHMKKSGSHLPETEINNMLSNY